MSLLNEVINNERAQARNAKVQWMREQGISVEFLPNGKMKIEDPQNRIEDFMIYDEPNRAIETAYSIAHSWLGDRQDHEFQ